MRADLDMLEALARCRSPEDLRGAIAKLTEQMGFPHWVYALGLGASGANARQFVLSGYPPDWVAHYLARDYIQIDPMVAHCQAHATPLAWSPKGLPLLATPDNPKTAKTFFNEAGEFGLASGISVPVHGLGCQWGLLSLASPQGYKGRDLRGMVPWAYMLASYSHEAGHHFAQEENEQVAVQLTTREIECMTWAAGGKTSWEIGRLLSISERTAVFHLHNAMVKLGSISRQQAVARSIVLGLIKP